MSEQFTELWNVVYQYHDKNEVYSVKTVLVGAESIGQALSNVDSVLSEIMERESWSDYHIVGINIITELH